jgi:hypothetical protein
MTASPINLLILNYEFPPIGGGTGTACRQVLERFSRDSSLRCDVVTSGLGRELEAEQLSETIRVFKLPVGKRELHYWRMSEIARWTWGARRFCHDLVMQRA